MIRIPLFVVVAILFSSFIVHCIASTMLHNSLRRKQIDFFGGFAGVPGYLERKYYDSIHSGKSPEIERLISTMRISLIVTLISAVGVVGLLITTTK